ncbi:hypothetical protein MMC13_000607 [Lambiella insularis]|nr:hypothetical protein [Lambiella insularis]
MEYYPLGDLARYIDGTITEEYAKQIVTDVLTGLSIMHREGFAHRDLKPKNIFVVQRPPASPKWWVKIGDFGLSKRVQGEESAFRTFGGTAAYMAPEIWNLRHLSENGLKRIHYSSAVDIWSLGCVIFELLTTTRAFQNPVTGMQDYSRQGVYLEQLLTEKLSQEGIRLVKDCLDLVPERRPTAQLALESPWILGTIEPKALAHHEASKIAQDTSVVHRTMPDQRVEERPRSKNAGNQQRSVEEIDDLEDKISNIGISRALCAETAQSKINSSPSIEPFGADVSSRNRSEPQRQYDQALQLLASVGFRPKGPNALPKELLIFAAEKNHTEAVRLLLESGVDPNSRSEAYCYIGETTWAKGNATALTVAACAGHTVVVTLLLHKGADLEGRTSFMYGESTKGGTALYFAVRSGRIDCVRALLESGADIEVRWTWTIADVRSEGSILWSAVVASYGNVVKLLLEKGANTEAPTHVEETGKDTNPCCALHIAAESDYELTRLLLDAEANIEIKDSNGWTPLHYAARKGKEDVASLLLERGAFIEAGTIAGYTALHMAVGNGHTATVRLLLDCGASANTHNSYGATSLHCAAASRKDSACSIGRLLLERGASVDARDELGMPLHYAAGKGHAEFVQLLLESGADATLTNWKGEDALTLARRGGHEKVISLLKPKAVPKAVPNAVARKGFWNKFMSSRRDEPTHDLPI